MWGPDGGGGGAPAQQWGSPPPQQQPQQQQWGKGGADSPQQQQQQQQQQPQQQWGGNAVASPPQQQQWAPPQIPIQQPQQQSQAWGKGGGDMWGQSCGGKDAGKDGGKGFGKDQGYGGGKGDGKGKGGGGYGGGAGDFMAQMWSGAGKGGAAASEWKPEQVAWVKNWNEDRGFGFVTCASGEDVYVHRTNLTDGQTLVAGAEVWVEAKWSFEKDKWAATRCCGATGKGGEKGKGGFGKGGDKGMGAPAKGCGKGKGKRGDTWMAGIQSWVKSWNEERGFGFVVTDRGEDIYAHRTSLTDGSCLTPEAEVYLDCTWDYEKNKWKATKVSGASGEPKKIAGIDQPFACGVQGGLVKVWHEKGFGFIVPDLGGPDVFVHQASIVGGGTGLTAGEVCVFDLQYDTKRSKYLAASCAPGSDASVLPPSPAADAGSGFGPAASGNADLRSEPYSLAGP